MGPTIQSRLARFGHRFQARHFDLKAHAWRHQIPPAQGIVSSLAVHHLDEVEKAELFSAICSLLVPGGIFLVADIIRPTTETDIAYAARQWDASVREVVQRVDEKLTAYEQFVRQRWNHYLYPNPEDKPSSLLDQLRWLREAGFVQVDVYWMKAGHVLFGAVRPI